MWLVASQAADTNNGELVRERVLGYLTEGYTATAMLKLAEQQPFSFNAWIAQWRTISSSSDARELRSAAARLLGSYPEHPGLLLSRGISEAFLTNGDENECANNILQALQQATMAYGVSGRQVSYVVAWLLD